MVADITGEIQKYQNMPYNLQVEPSIRTYLESLDPLAGRGDTELNDYLYEISLMIEPRNAKQPAKFVSLYFLSRTKYCAAFFLSKFLQAVLVKLIGKRFA